MLRLAWVPLVFAAALAAQTDVAKLARTAADLLVRERYSELTAQFNPEMKTALTEQALAAGVQPRVRELGRVKRILEPEIAASGDYQVATVGVEFEKAAMNVVVSFDKNGQIAGLFLRPRQPAVAWLAPAYIKPAQFRDVEVTFGLPEWKLPGTLAVPSGNGPFPAVVLVHGSGPE